MKSKPLRISAVSYINAKPFVYGIENSGFLSRLNENSSNDIKNYSLSLDMPSVCAEKLISNKADIGLAPIAIIPKLKEYYIFPDFCIGANGPVKTVMLYSEVPLKEIKTIYLDYQSRTSVMLVRILAKHWWKISPVWIQAKKGYEEKIKKANAGLIIGDRNFSISGKYKFAFDLSEEWKFFTGLPLIFACWITNKELDEDIAISFYKSLKYGIDNRDKVVKNTEKKYDSEMISNYLNHYINYSFDKSKWTAMDLFLKLGKKIRNP